MCTGFHRPCDRSYTVPSEPDADRWCTASCRWSCNRYRDHRWLPGDTKSPEHYCTLCDSRFAARTGNTAAVCSRWSHTGCRPIRKPPSSRPAGSSPRAHCGPKSDSNAASFSHSDDRCRPRKGVGRRDDTPKRPLGRMRLLHTARQPSLPGRSRP